MISAKAGSSALRLSLRPRPAGSSVSADLVGAGSGSLRRPRLVVVIAAQTTPATINIAPIQIAGMTLSFHHNPTRPHSFPRRIDGQPTGKTRTRPDRTSGVEGTSVSVSADLGSGSIIKKNRKNK